MTIKIKKIELASMTVCLEDGSEITWTGTLLKPRKGKDKTPIPLIDSHNKPGYFFKGNKFISKNEAYRLGEIMDEALMALSSQLKKKFGVEQFLFRIE